MRAARHSVGNQGETPVPGPHIRPDAAEPQAWAVPSDFTQRRKGPQRRRENNTPASRRAGSRGDGRLEFSIRDLESNVSASLRPFASLRETLDPKLPTGTFLNDPAGWVIWRILLGSVHRRGHRCQNVSMTRAAGVRSTGRVLRAHRRPSATTRDVTPCRPDRPDPTRSHHRPVGSGRGPGPADGGGVAGRSVGDRPGGRCRRPTSASVRLTPKTCTAGRILQPPERQSLGSAEPQPYGCVERPRHQGAHRSLTLAARLGLPPGRAGVRISARSTLLRSNSVVTNADDRPMDWITGASQVYL